MKPLAKEAKKRNSAVKDIDRGDPATTGFRLENYPFYLVAQVDHRYADGMEETLRPHGMDRPKWRVLLCLKEKNPSSIGEIAQLASMKLSTISRVADRMRKDGLVETAPREQDNRVTDVFITERGLEALDRILRVTSKQYQRALDGLDNDQVAVFCDTLRHILTNLKRSPLE